MNWLICGTIPDRDFPLSYDSWSLEYSFNNQQEKSDIRASSLLQNKNLILKNTQGETLEIHRGTSALIASTLVNLQNVAHVNDGLKNLASESANFDNSKCSISPNITVKALLVGDTGTGEGSKKLYEKLAHQILLEEFFDGITFHYLFPDVDWHNLVLIAAQNQEEIHGKAPLLIADAGFMYVAKMSGYADKYDIFTPDIGEMAFLADEHAPHPFYTRGFLLAKEHDIPNLLEHANAHKNISKNLIIKGETDYIVLDGKIVAKINTPSVPSMEAIGGTGDLVTGLLTAQLIQKKTIQNAMFYAVEQARIIAKFVNPNPSTQIAEILTKILLFK